VLEDLDVAAMKRSMGRRAYRRAVSDAAMGAIGPQLAYKSTRYGGNLVVADRWFASSQIHHGCTAPDGTPCRLLGHGRIDKLLVCPLTGESSTVTSTLHVISATGRITPVVAQPGPRPHRYPGQPHLRLVQAMARTPDHPAPAELP
jgi:putative transposase